MVLAGFFITSENGRTQELFRSHLGNSSGDDFGRALAPAGDVNADGHADYMVGAHLDNSNGTNSGSVWVYSGFDGSVLYFLKGAQAGDEFGHSVDGVGDLNADGYADFIVGADFADGNGVNSGSAWVYSGANGSVLYTFAGSPGDLFGLPVRGAGDVNADGVPDLIVGLRAASASFPTAGAAQVISGLNGSTLYTILGDSAGDELGHWVGRAGDVDADGYDDFIVGAHRDDDGGMNAGSASVYSGFDGSLLYRFDGGAAEDRFGRFVEGAGDINMDGHADFIIAAPRHDGVGTDSGKATVYSGLDGSVMYEFFGTAAGDRFGNSVCSPGDVDADGIPDFLISSPTHKVAGSPVGSVWLFAGVNGAPLYEFHGEGADDIFGIPACGIGDVNQDGFDDVMIAAPQNDQGGTNAGKAQIFKGNDLFLSITSTTMTGGQIAFTLGVGDAGRPFQLFVTAINGFPTFVKVPLNGALNAAGRWTFATSVPSDPELDNGLTVTFRALVLSTASGILSSGDESVTFLPVP